MIDVTKEYKTRNGLKVSHLISRENEWHQFKIDGIIHMEGGLLIEAVWNENGRFYGDTLDSSYDLFEVKEKEEELITQEDYDMVCRENTAFARHLVIMGFTDTQINNIANGGEVND